MLLNLMRGAGSKGLAGIPPVRDEIVRPLLYNSKKDILKALDAFNIPYVIDSTNNECDYKRNYIRNEILPKFDKLYEFPEEIALRASSNLRSDSDFIEKTSRDFINSFDKNKIPSDSLAKLHPSVLSRVVSFLAVSGGASGIEAVHILKIKELLSSSDSFEVCLPGESRFVCRRGICFVTKHTDELLTLFDRKLSMGENYIPEIDSFICLTNAPINVCSSNVYKISIQTSIDFGIINGEIRVRNKRDGDSYVYSGMTRKLKKLFNDITLQEPLST
jgi:tRNA(Ile)-lysidine synthase